MLAGKAAAHGTGGAAKASARACRETCTKALSCGVAKPGCIQGCAKANRERGGHKVRVARVHASTRRDEEVDNRKLERSVLCACLLKRRVLGQGICSIVLAILGVAGKIHGPALGNLKVCEGQLAGRVEERVCACALARGRVRGAPEIDG